MIRVYDNFMAGGVIKLMADTPEEDFKVLKTKTKDFHMILGIKPVDDFILNKLGGGKKVLSFMRLSSPTKEAGWHVHSDSYIMGRKVDRVATLYVSPEGMSDLNGTAFWSHAEQGPLFRGSPAEHDRMLVGENSDLANWNLDSVIGYKQNRLLDYPADLFHSKYPDSGWKTNRMIYVLFYKEGL